MAWDFSTDPEFERELDWMRGFVREEIWPLETHRRRARAGAARPDLRAAAGAGQGARAVGGAPGPRAGRPGLRPGQARAHARDPRDLALRAQRVRQPGARLRQQRDPRAGRDARSRRSATCTRCWPGDLKSAFSMTEPDSAGLGPDAAEDPRRPRRRRLRHHRAQVVLLQRLDRRLPHRHGGHRPRRAPAPARDDVPRARRHAGRDDPARRPDDGAPAGVLRQARRPRGDPLRGRPGPGRRPPRRRGRGLPHRPAAARTRAASTTACAGWASRSGPSTCSASARPTARRTARCSGEHADGPELDRRLGGADAGRAPDDAARRVEDGHPGRHERRARRSR